MNTTTRPNGSKLPPELAFVVQLSPALLESPDFFQGRVEHVLSGEAQRFSSPDELLAFLGRVGGRGATAMGFIPGRQRAGASGDVAE